MKQEYSNSVIKESSESKFKVLLSRITSGSKSESSDLGGFQLEFVSISRVINHMTCYKFKCSHWWKIYLKKNPLQDLLSSLNSVISTNERH